VSVSWNRPSQDAVILKVAEEALTAFMDTPLKFGAVCIEAKKEEWRLTRQWARMFADHINFIITNPGTAPKDELRDMLDRALDLIVLLSNKLAFINYHKRHLAKRLLNPVKGFESYCLELENVVISRMQLVCDGSLLSKCTLLLRDHDSSRQFSEELLKSKELEQRKASLVPVEDFDMRYLSKRVWRECGVWYDNAQEWVCPNIMMPPVLERCRAAFDEFCVRARPRHTPEWQPVFSECRVELYFNKKKVSITCDAVVATILSLFETPETVIKLSDIESRTGVKGLLLSAVMEQLCMKRPREGMSTGLLQANKDEDPAYRFHSKFEFKGKDPKFRIETPSRVIHSLKTSVTQEISGMQKQQMQGAIIRVIKRFGTSPPQNELFREVKAELLRWCPLTKNAFQDNVETLLTEGKIIRADADAGTLRIAGGNTAAGGAAAGGT